MKKVSVLVAINTNRNDSWPNRSDTVKALLNSPPFNKNSLAINSSLKRCWKETSPRGLNKFQLKQIHSLSVLVGINTTVRKWLSLRNMLAKLFFSADEPEQRVQTQYLCENVGWYSVLCNAFTWHHQEKGLNFLKLMGALSSTCYTL